MKKIIWSERIKRPPWMLTFESYLRKQDHPIASHPEARDNRIVPLVVIDFGSFMARMRQMRYVGKYLVRSIKEMHVSAKSIRNNPYSGKTTIDSDTLKELEDYVYSLGITDIGYTKVNTRHIFKRFKLLYPNAIVFTMEMDKEKIKAAPSMPSFIEVFRTYQQLGIIVNKIADFLRERGYNALAQPAVGADISLVPVAVDAGLGYIGKNGLIITKNNGPRVRLAALVTDIENLPFSGENPHHWVREYCETCNLCIEKCPSDAIFMEPQTHKDGGPVFIDYTKCAAPFSNDNGCTLCIKHCPFSYGDYNKMKSKFEARQA
ncbi:MAG: 4Fe-4S dicluster domain-containing protein [Pseudomonadota bacterium]